MTNSPKITVIIPTRERCDVLKYALRTATSQDSDNLEIIVSDNFSNDDTREIALSENDPRIRYLNTGRRLSMTHNWEFALSHVSDGWVTFMGDDDGLMPSSIGSLADIIRSTQAKVIRTDFCTYDWPGMRGRSGQLIVPMGSGMEVRNSRKWLTKVLLGRRGYNQLPMIYNGGFTHVSILNEIKDKTGSFFSSVNPDVYTAVAIARAVEEYLYIRTPFAISGTSRHSNGHSAFSASRNAAPYKKFISEGNIPFHSELPLTSDGSLPLSLQACTYEAYLQSRKLGNDIDGINHKQQLRTILITSGKHRDSISEWCREFAAMHDLDLATARQFFATERTALQFLTATRKTLKAMHSVISDRLPITNVHEAAVAASVIRMAPGRKDSFHFFRRELLQRIALPSSHRKN